MLNFAITRALIERLRQGHRTLPFPSKKTVLPERYRGCPTLGTKSCPPDCSACADCCPTGAIKPSERGLSLDLGRCLFCGECAEACREESIAFTREYRLATSSREELVLGHDGLRLAIAEQSIKKLFGRSLKLRQVSAGGCNACEADVNVLGTLAYDLGRFGIQFVASPRHADGLLITGPVTQNMRSALKETYDAVPSPKIVIAVGACAISGGMFIGHPEVQEGAMPSVPVDLFVPGCPPHPLTILDGLLRILGKAEVRG